MATILIVDDRRQSREFLSTLLDHLGHNTIHVSDGPEAISAVREKRPDLIISDVLMPTMDGVEFVNMLHADSAVADIPIIFYTASYRLAETRRLAESCGVKSVVGKLAAPQEIADAIESALGPLASAGALSRTTTPGISPISSFAQPASYLDELSELQQRLQRTLGNGFQLIGQANHIPSLTEPLTQAFDTVQVLSLRLSALIELGLELLPERDPQQLLNQFCRSAQSIMNTRYAAVGMQDEEGKRLRHIAVRGMSQADATALRNCDPCAGVFGEVLRTGCPRYLADSDAESALLHPRARTALIVPVRVVTRSYGWLYLAEKLGGGDFSKEDEQFAITLAAQLALVYESLSLYGEVEQHAVQLEVEVVEKRRALEDLEESESRLRQVTENMRDVFFLATPNFTQMFYVSPAYAAVFGRSCESLYAKPDSWLDVIHLRDRQVVMRALPAMWRTGEFDQQFRAIISGGETRWIHIRTFPIRDHNGQLFRIAGVAEDVTEQLAQQGQITRLSQASTVLSGINSAIVRIRDRKALFHEACRIIVDKGAFRMAWIGEIDPDTQDGKVVAWYGGEPGYVENIRLTARPDLPDSWRPACVAVREHRPVICNDVSTEPSLDGYHEMLLARGHRAMAAFPLRLDDCAVAVIALFANEKDFFDDEEVKLLTDLSRDVSFGLQYIERERQVNYLACYDTLTELPNRTLFLDRLTLFVNGSIHGQNKLAVILLDVDHFKQINDAYGRHVGDEALRLLAKRWGEALIEPFSLARVGPDIFAVAVGDLPQAADATTILRDRLFGPIEEPFMVHGCELKLTARAGIAMYPEDGTDAETLFQHAEAALKQTKAAVERHFYYDPLLNAKVAEKLALEAELRSAIAGHQFVLHYQPRVDLARGDIVGAEALIRWQHPERGIVSPATFIPLAEETGMIVAIGAWVIKTVCAQQAAWLVDALEIVPVAVNLSAEQLGTGGVLECLCDALAINQLDAKYLELELTESAVMRDPEEAALALQAFRKMGLKLSLDDFGTGYSSLAYLKRFPFDFLKIDRAFVTHITQNPEDAAIAKAVIALAHQLKLKTVAEGVETEGQLNYLRQHGCDEMQGFYFSRPLPAEEFAALLREHRQHIFDTQANVEKGIVLLVDDEPEMLVQLKHVFRQEGYQLLTAESGYEALEILALHKVQVIVSDQQMPNMSGVEFLDIAKELYPDTIRIILSGHIDLDVLFDAINRGAVYKFLSKPWRDELLREHLRDAFRRYRPSE